MKLVNSPGHWKNMVPIQKHVINEYLIDETCGFFLYPIWKHCFLQNILTGQIGLKVIHILYYNHRFFET